MRRHVGSRSSTTVSTPTPCTAIRPRSARTARAVSGQCPVLVLADAVGVSDIQPHEVFVEALDQGWSRAAPVAPCLPTDRRSVVASHIDLGGSSLSKTSARIDSGSWTLWASSEVVELPLSVRTPEHIDDAHHLVVIYGATRGSSNRERPGRDAGTSTSQARNPSRRDARPRVRVVARSALRRSDEARRLESNSARRATQCGYLR
jgi:hypothetical protein